MPAKKQRSSVPVLFMLAGVLLVGGAIAGYFFLIGNNSPGANPSQTEIVNVDDITRVNIVEAKDAFDTQAAVFVDVRSSDVFAQDHIPGAISIPLEELDARMDELDPNAWIITYCT
jgi:hypothetical protein